MPVFFDFNDNGSSTGNGYGSMQIHNYGASQTIMAYNRWSFSGNSGNEDIGIGNQPTGNPDWTFAQNSASFATKNLYVFWCVLAKWVLQVTIRFY